MPTFAEAPARAFTPEQLIRWLDQIADDPDLSPIASRAAVKLAADFACGLASVSFVIDDMAKALGVTFNTAKRALLQLRSNGHLATERGQGAKTIYAPILKSEA